MKAIIKKITKENGDTFIKVFSSEKKEAIETIFVYNEETEKKAIGNALKIAKRIESNELYTEEIIYETGVNSIDYFIASNMTDEQISDHLKNVM